MKNSRLYLTLFLKSLLLSASTFGGGFVIVSLMRNQYVDRLHLLSEEDMMDIIAISQSAPGAVAVNASVVLGYKTGGIPGAVLCTVGTVLPPFFIMSVIAGFYGLLKDNPYSEKLMAGMQAGVAAVILHAVLGMTKTAFRTHRRVYYVLFGGILLLSLLFDLNPGLCIAIAVVLGLADAALERRHSDGTR